jgi:hypothetical protein
MVYMMMGVCLGMEVMSSWQAAMYKAFYEQQLQEQAAAVSSIKVVSGESHVVNDDNSIVKNAVIQEQSIRTNAPVENVNRRSATATTSSGKLRALLSKRRSSTSTSVHLDDS